MHEMSYVTGFVNLAIQAARDNHAKKVNKITVQIGEMTDIEPYYLKHYYPLAVKDTILEGSVLEVEPVEAQIRCNQCKKLYHPSRETYYLCPCCGSGDGHIEAGREILLKNLEIE